MNLSCEPLTPGLCGFSSLCVCLQASVSLKRLRVFLSHEELQEDSVEHKVIAGCESLFFRIWLCVCVSIHIHKDLNSDTIFIILVLYATTGFEMKCVLNVVC